MEYDYLFHYFSIYHEIFIIELSSVSVYKFECVYVCKCVQQG